MKLVKSIRLDGGLMEVEVEVELSLLIFAREGWTSAKPDKDAYQTTRMGATLSRSPFLIETQSAAN